MYKYIYNNYEDKIQKLSVDTRQYHRYTNFNYS